LNFTELDLFYARIKLKFKVSFEILIFTNSISRCDFIQLTRFSNVFETTGNYQ